MRKFAVLAASLSAGLVGMSTARADITVGVIYSLTGPGSALGIPSQKAAALGPTEIAGEKVRYVVLDDASDPSVAVQNARKLIQEEKVDLILGPTNTPQVVAVANVTWELKVPQISNSPVGMPAGKGDWLISIPSPVEIWVRKLVKQMVGAGVKRVAFIGFTDPWGDLCIDALTREAASAGIEIVASERYARTDTSVKAQILKIMAAKPDAVFVGGSGTPGALPHITLAERGFKGRQYDTPAVFMQDFLKVGGAALEGVFAATGPIGVAEQLPDSNPIKPVALDFIKKYEGLYGTGTANAFAGFAYDCTLIFTDAATRALKKAKPGTPEFRTALRDEMFATKDLTGVHAVYTFAPGSAFGVDERSAVIVKIEQGKWKLAE